MPIRATLPMAVGLLLVVRSRIRMPGWLLTPPAPVSLCGRANRGRTGFLRPWGARCFRQRRSVCGRHAKLAGWRTTNASKCPEPTDTRLRHRAPELPSRKHPTRVGKLEGASRVQTFRSGCPFLHAARCDVDTASERVRPGRAATPSQSAGRPDQYRAAGGKHGPWRPTQGCEHAVNRAQNFASAGEHGSSRPVGAFSASLCGVSSAIGRCSHPPALRNTEVH